MSILSTHNLSVGYRKSNSTTVVLHDLELSLHQGELIALVGANGIGKSTLLRTISGTQSPICGSVEIDGKELKDIRKNDLAKVLALVYTDRTMAGGLTARELVSLGRQPHTGFFGRLSKHDDDVVSHALESTGIAHKADSFVAELSDGERQKVMIAKALAQETPIIILDEPTAFLDVASRTEAMMLLHSLAHEFNKAVLLSSHDLSQSILLADKLWVVTSNHTLLHGTTEDLVLSGAMNEMFNSSKVEFDLEIGDFRIALPTAKAVRLVCDDDILRHWTANALYRNGFSIAADDDDTDITITANTATQFSITSSDTAAIPATSISQLISILTNR